VFEISNQQAKLSSFNSRAELHGEDREPAGDIKFEMNVASSILAHFAPTLAWSLYHRDGGKVKDLADSSHDAPDLRYPKLGPLKWDQEFGPGYTLVIHQGLGGAGSDLEIEMCTVNNFTLAPQQGGTVIVTFRVQFHPEEHAAGRLCMLVQETVDISLAPPPAERAKDLAA